FPKPVRSSGQNFYLKYYRRFLEYNASALCVFWSTTLQLCAFFGVQRFSFVRFLESKINHVNIEVN
ncbi:MAG: hypothetical protein KAI83_03230, partial [Thiomargarita sp.]|nr:hypothetical protein [Thiomargarita sp.]